MLLRRPGTPDWVDDGLVAELDGNLWHATNRFACKQILRDGYIKSDAPATYENGFCRSLGAISLFDLSCADPGPPISHWCQWICRDPKEPSYWFEVNRKLAASGLIGSEVLLNRWREKSHGSGGLILAGIEAAFIGRLHLDQLLRIIEIRGNRWRVIRLPCDRVRKGSKNNLGMKHSD